MMTRRPALAVLAALVGTAALSAAPALAAAKPTPAKVACTYFKTLFASTDATEPSKAADLAAPGSLALDYAIHQAGLRSASRAAGYPDPAELVQCSKSKVVLSVAGTSVTTTTTPAGTTNPSASSTYTAFKLDKSGKLVSFKNGGKSLDGRIVAGTSAPVQALGVTFKFVTGYEGVQSGGDLFVLLDVTGAPDGDRYLNLHDSTYQGAAGKVQASAAIGPFKLLQGVATKVALVFPAQSVGGTATVPVQGTNYDPAVGGLPTANAEIPIVGT